MCRNQNKQLVFSPTQMLPYFRSMEAFFNLSLPTDWQSLSDSQLQYFFTLLSDNLPMEEILTICLFKWADLRVLCKTHDGSYLVKHRQEPKHETTLTIRQVQAATASLDFLRQFAPIMIALFRHVRYWNVIISHSDCSQEGSGI